MRAALLLSLLAASTATYVQLPVGTRCADAALITTAAECEAASAALPTEDSDHRVANVDAAGYPPGCFLLLLSGQEILHFNADLSSVAAGVLQCNDSRVTWTEFNCTTNNSRVRGNGRSHSIDDSCVSESVSRPI